ncbi:MAG: zf-HC2 domain-containing protein [Syntrophomonadaceae bacterium]|nr:zf-HC2 domain-containing protein [Syntrophomonadaceae bacterium]
MECNHEMLQLFLDRELEPEQAKELKKHLARCRECRQELSRLKLMWLELEQEEELDLPPELPFLRQQAITAARTLSQMSAGEFSYWQSQKLAWEPVTTAITLIPGTRTLSRAARAIGSRIPSALEVVGKKGLKLVFRGRS